MPETLRFALVGAGAVIAEQHLKALAAVADARLVGVCDRNPAAAEALASRTDAPFFTDHRTMLATVRPDVTVVATPHPSHAAIAIDALDAESHVLVEKPIAPQVAEADAMIAAAERAGRLLAVAFQRRFAPLAVRARELVEAGVVGPLVRVACSEPWLRTASYFRAAGWRATWRGEGGGVLLNQAPHTLDLLCHLTGVPVRVWGMTRTLRHDIECEDTAQALLEFGNGGTGHVAVSTGEGGAERRLELVGERGRLLLEGDRLHVRRFEPSLDRWTAEGGDPYGTPAALDDPVVALSPDGSHADVYRDLVAAVREGRPPRVDGREALASLELANAIVLSSHLERPVDLPVDRAAYAAWLEERRRHGTPQRRRPTKP